MKEKEKYAAQAAKAAVARVLDNREVALAHYLRGKLPNTETLRLVSAYFSVYGYAGLAEELDEVGETKFLSGDPNFTAEVIVGGKKHRRFELSNEELSSEVYSAESMSTEDTMRQREWAKRCAKWIEEKVEVRTIKKTNFMHGKMWHLHLDDGKTAATVGSSNFTRRGLGLAQNYNLELNISVEERDTRDKLAEWFDDIWNNENLTKDAKTICLPR